MLCQEKMLPSSTRKDRGQKSENKGKDSGIWDFILRGILLSRLRGGGLRRGWWWPFILRGGRIIRWSGGRSWFGRILRMWLKEQWWNSKD